MKFNQELITKARKGEIAILNDGTKEELCEVLSVCCPQYQGNPSGTAYKYEVRNGKWFAIGIPSDSEIPAHSVKHFFMPDTKTIKGSEGGNEYIQINGGVDAEPENGKAYVGKPRTYRVTRQQMKEIVQFCNGEGSEQYFLDCLVSFDKFYNDHQFSDHFLKVSCSYFNDNEPALNYLKSQWPEYFHIPEGEPVLVRETDSYNWLIAISDGKGGAYTHFNTPESSFQWTQIIPFAKNPPK